MAGRPLQLLTVTAVALLAGCSGTPFIPDSVTTGQNTSPAAGNSSPTSTNPTSVGTNLPRTTTPGLTPPVTAAAVPPPPNATPDTVAMATTRAWLSYDTRIDQRPNDTARRLALPLLTSTLRQQILAHAPNAAAGATWDNWTRRHAYATVTVRIGSDDRPADTTTSAWRQVQATLTLHGDQGWTETQQQTQFLELARTPLGWRVAQLTATSGT